MTPDRIICPRCGESLPATLHVCDACAYDVGGKASAATPPPPSRPPARSGNRPGPAKRDAIPGIAWLLLVVGLAVGGMVGFALHSAIGPRAESGMPAGPADIMAGASGATAGGDGGAAPDRGMAGGAPPRVAPPNVAKGPGVQGPPPE